MSQGSIWEQALGADFARLPAAVRRFHQLAGAKALYGWVETQAPATLAARWLACCLGSPQRAGRGPIRFDLLAEPGSETWTRHFPSHTMRSQLRQVPVKAACQVEERLGPARLRFELQATEAGLNMKLARLHFLGVPCPRWLMPRVMAQEGGGEGELHFRVEATLPWVGRVAGYHGHLVVPGGGEGAGAAAEQEWPR